MDRTAKRSHKQDMWIASLDSVSRIHSLVLAAAVSAAHEMEAGRSSREVSDKAAFLARFSSPEAGETYWLERQQRDKVELEAATKVRVVVWDRAHENSAEGDYEEVMAHFAPSNIGEIHFRVGSYGHVRPSLTLHVDLSRKQGASVDVEAESTVWADGQSQAFRGVFREGQPWYRFVVHPPWIELALVLPPLCAFALVGLAAVRDDNKSLKLFALLAATIALWVFPMVGMALRQHVPRFETYSVGEQPKARGIVAAVGFALSLTVTIGFGVAAFFT